ncbi:MAG TPA: response regulator [Thermoanaerobaculia bacterium]|nr:response regulator [Thermoanaerobaculia bacterium]
MSIRVLIADDHEIFRAGLRRLIDDAADLVTVGEAMDGRDAVAQSRSLDPDVVLLDVLMPGRGAAETIDDLLRLPQPPAVLVLTAHPEDHYSVRLLRAGARGYLTKGCGAEELLAAIRKVASGGRHIGERLAETLAFSVAGEAENPVDALSERERQVLILLASGSTINQIADQLALSPKTVSTYRSRTLEKLGLRGNAELVRFALQNGLLE